MATCFISYSRSDAEFTRRLAVDLQKLKINYWLDVDHIQAGEDWDDAVWTGLQKCDLMLLVLSPASMTSKEVSNEWKYYLSQDKSIIPMLVTPTDNLHYRLVALQYVDFHHDDYDTAIENLVAEIERVAAEKGLSFHESDASEAGPTAGPVIDPQGVTGELPHRDELDDEAWERTTTRIDPVMAKQLEEKLHYFNEKMVLEFISYEHSEMRIQSKVGRGREYIIGRSGKGVVPDVDLTPLGAATQGISRQHAALVVDGDTLFIKDLNSTNFTYVEGKRLRGTEQLALKSGDRVQFGSLLLTIHFRNN
jgi:hypothetical protein